MSRSTIWRYADPMDWSDYDREVGTLDHDTAQYWPVGSTSTGHKRVWLTPSGRWVWTAPKRCSYLTPLEARQLLVAAGYDNDVRELIDKAQDGRGRPEIGPEAKARLPQEAIDQLDALAKLNGTSRADEMRALILDGLAALR
jgi:hypothetical protein